VSQVQILSPRPLIFSSFFLPTGAKPHLGMWCGLPAPISPSRCHERRAFAVRIQNHSMHCKNRVEAFTSLRRAFRLFGYTRSSKPSTIHPSLSTCRALACLVSIGTYGDWSTCLSGVREYEISCITDAAVAAGCYRADVRPARHCSRQTKALKQARSCALELRRGIDSQQSLDAREL
jgi:hypothetical protein